MGESIIFSTLRLIFIGIGFIVAWPFEKFKYAYHSIVAGALGRKKVAFKTGIEDGEAGIEDGPAGQENVENMRKVLTWFDLTCFGIGGIIGSGVYILSGKTAHNVAGPSVVLSFIIAGTFCIFSGLCYAEFGARAAGSKGSSGSAYSYAYVSLGEFAAWIIGWDLVLVSMFVVMYTWRFSSSCLVLAYRAGIWRWLSCYFKRLGILCCKLLGFLWSPVA